MSSRTGTRRLGAWLAFCLLSYSVTGHSQATFLPHTGNPIPAPEALLGVWGTAAQCKAHRAGKTDDMRLLPYDIGDQWLRHGFLYCWMGWQQVVPGTHGRSTIVLARCGEDAVRFYRLIIWQQEDKLFMRWSKDYETPALERCE